MNNFALIITSSVTAASLTKVVDYILSNQNYKREYYKRIIDKRLEAYSLIDSIISDLVVESYNEQGTYKKIFNSYTECNQFTTKLLNCGNNRIWYSRDIADKIFQLGEVIFNGIIEHAPSKDAKQVDYVKVGISIHKDIITIINQIEQNIFLDLSNLYKVKRFLKLK